MSDEDDDKEVDVSSQASNTEEAVFDSTSTADYTSLSDLLDGTSIDEMYPEVLPLSPLPDVGKTNTIDEPLDYDYPYEPIEPNQPVNLLDRIKYRIKGIQTITNRKLSAAKYSSIKYGKIRLNTARKG